MLPTLPSYLSFTFELLTLVTIGLFTWAVRVATMPARSNAILLSLLGWLVLQGVLSALGEYSAQRTEFPPKLLLFGILPTLFAIVLVVCTTSGQAFMDKLPLVLITYLHTIRLGVELVFIGLFTYRAIPQLMTFEGRNFDILVGITAPIVGYLYGKQRLSRPVLLGWNVLGLALLVNIVGTAFLSAPTPIQQVGFEQPNVAILYFPFSWLPTVVVPLILFAHLTALRQLWRKPAYESAEVAN